MFKQAKVSSEIKKSNTILWYRTNNIDYVGNGYWIIKTDLKKEENRKILCSLVERFGFIPEEGKEIITTSYKKKDGITENSTKPKWIELLENRETDSLENTKLIHMFDGNSCRIFKGKEYVYINSKFIEMVNEDNVDIKFEGNGDLEPIFIQNEDDLIMILPIRMESKSEYLKP